MGEDDPNRGYLNEILRILPVEYGNLTSGEGEVKPGYSDLVALNAQVQWDVHQYNTSRVYVYNNVLFLLNVGIDCSNKPLNKRFTSRIFWRRDKMSGQNSKT